MRTFDIPYLADWVVSSLRWVMFLGITFGLAVSENLNLSNGGLLLLLAVLWNLFSTLLAILYRRLKAHRPINLTVDTLICLALYGLNGGAAGPIAWVGALAICSASIYYEWKGSLSIFIVLTLLEAGWGFLSQPGAFHLQAFLPVIAFNLLVALVMALVSGYLMRHLRLSYQTNVQLRKNVEAEAKLAERNRLQAFYQMVETVSATLNYQVVIDTVLDLCSNAIGGEDGPAGQMVSAVLLFGEHDLNVVSARRFVSRDQQHTFPAEKGALQESLARAEPILISAPSTDPELGKILALQTCKKALILSLRRGVNSYGAMLFAHPEEGFFTTERLQLLEMISHQAVIAIQNARLYQDLEAEKERIVQTQEEARKKLARDLHDGPIQSVAAIAMRVDVARHLLPEPDQATDELSKIEDLARRTTKELRHMLFTLRPLALESDGLVPALQAMADKTRETFQQNVQIDIDSGLVSLIELGKQTVIFYLCEEAVNNARKHAQASLIMIRFKFLPQQPDIAALEIIDNGVGFDVQEVLGSYERRGSLGMINLQERSDLVNGLLHIDSVPGKGTRIRILIPLNEAASDLLQRGKVK